MLRALVIAFLYVTAAAAEPSSQTRAFPGAEGHGRWATGGRGGDVYHVTSLEDSGPGSLREGIESADGPRTIVFDTGGTIMLTSRLRFEGSGLTIAGQTAPGDGITVRGHNFSLKNASHVIIRYVRFRLGDANPDVGGADVLSIDDSDHIILDHVSASWGIDGIQDERGCTNYTLQWSIFGEALHDSIHPKGPHAMCASFREPRSHMTIHHNLFTTSRDRHPTLGGGTTDEPHWVIDFRNNVVYNWNGAANVCDNQVNLIANYFKPGPETPADRLPIAMKSNLPLAAHGYMEGNIFEGRDDLTANNYAALDFERWLGPDSKYRYDGTIDDWRVDAAFPVEAPDTSPAQQAYDDVLAKAGASLVRDAVDARLVRNVKEREGRLIDSQEEVGGWPALEPGTPPVDTDRDGMPDAWELAKELDPQDAEDRNGDTDGDGYTNLEEYLNSLCD